MTTLSSGPCKLALVHVYIATTCVNATGQFCPTLKGGMTMVTKIAVAVALAGFLAVPSASFPASKAKNSHSALTQCQGARSTPHNPNPHPNTPPTSHHYRPPHTP